MGGVIVLYIIMFIIGILLSLSSIFTGADNLFKLWASLVCIVFPFIGIPYALRKDNKKKQRIINDYMSNNSIPSNADIICYYGGLSDIDEKLLPIKVGLRPEKYYLWKQGNKLKFMSYPVNYLYFTFPSQIQFTLNIEYIEYYNIIGDAYTRNNVIGDRYEKIRTETTRIDKRKTIITYRENEVIISISLSPEAYEVLMRLVPEKDINYVNASNIANGAEELPECGSSIYNNIRELAKLKEEGILTEEEFNDKKKMLLEKIG